MLTSMITLAAVTTRTVKMIFFAAATPTSLTKTNLKLPL